MGPGTPGAQRRALLLAPYFVPRRRVGAQRPLRFAAHLARHGWTPTVVCLDAGGDLTDRERSLLARVDVRRLAVPFDRTRATEHRDPGAHRAGSTHPSVLDDLMPVDTWLPVLLWHERRLAAIVREVGASVLWATADPWSSIVVGARVARRTGAAFVADLRDPWTLCPTRHVRRPRPTRAVDRRIEGWTLGRSAALVCTAEATAAAYRRHYGERLARVETIRNAFDLALLDGDIVGGPSPAFAQSRDGPLRVGFFGRFRALSPARHIADALARVPEPARGSIEIVSFGPLDADDRDHARGLGVDERFVQAAPVPAEGARARLEGFDLLLLSTDPARDDIVPAKLFDYLPVGRPILSVSPNPEVEEILRRTGTGASQDPGDAGGLARFLSEAVAAKRAGHPLPLRWAPDATEIARFEAQPATEKLARLFDAVKAGG